MCSKRIFNHIVYVSFIFCSPILFCGSVPISIYFYCYNFINTNISDFNHNINQHDYRRNSIKSLNNKFLQILTLYLIHQYSVPAHCNSFAHIITNSFTLDGIFDRRRLFELQHDRAHPWHVFSISVGFCVEIHQLIYTLPLGTRPANNRWNAVISQLMCSVKPLLIFARKIFISLME